MFYQEYQSSEDKESYSSSIDHLTKVLINDGHKNLRAEDYPSLQNQLDQLWHAANQGLFGDAIKDSDWFKNIKEIKDRWPRANL